MGIGQNYVAPCRSSLVGTGRNFQSIMQRGLSIRSYKISLDPKF